MKTLIIVETTKGREKLLRTAEEHLEEGEAIVRITDTISVESSTLTVPLDPDAEVMAREPPKVLPGGVTALTSYVRIPASCLRAKEYRLEQTEVVSSREITLKPERIGRKKKEAVENPESA